MISLQKSHITPMAKGHCTDLRAYLCGELFLITIPDLTLCVDIFIPFTPYFIPDSLSYADKLFSAHIFLYNNLLW